MKRIICLLLLVVSVQAADVYWNSGTGGAIDSPANWQSGVLPTVADNAYLDAASPYLYALTAASGAAVTVGEFRFNRSNAVLGLAFAPDSAIVANTRIVQDNARVLFTNGLLTAGYWLVANNGATLTVRGSNTVFQSPNRKGVSWINVGGNLVVDGGAKFNSGLAVPSNDNPGNANLVVSNAGTVISCDYQGAAWTIPFSVGKEGAQPSTALVTDCARIENTYPGGVSFLFGGGVNTRYSTGSRFELGSRAVITNASEAYALGGGITNTMIIDNASFYCTTFRPLCGEVARNNLLEIRNGAYLYNTFFVLCDRSTVSNNQIRISDPGTVVDTRGSAYLMAHGIGNTLSVTNGAQFLATGDILVMTSADACSNTVSVSGSGSVIKGANIKINQGSFNRFVVADGARIETANLLVGDSASAVGNSAVLDNCISTNTGNFAAGAGGTGNRIYIRNGAQAYSGAYFYVGSAGNSGLVRIESGSRVYNNNGIYLSDQGTTASNRLEVSGSGTVFESNWLNLCGLGGYDSTLIESNAVLRLRGGAGIGTKTGRGFCRLDITSGGSIEANYALTIGGLSSNCVMNLENGSFTTVLQLAYLGTATSGRNTLRIAGTNSYLRTPSFTAVSSPTLEFVLGAGGYIRTPIDIRGVFAADDSVAVKIDAEKFALEGGGRVVLMTTLNESYDLQKLVDNASFVSGSGSLVVEDSRKMLVLYVKSQANTVIKLF